MRSSKIVREQQQLDDLFAKIKEIQKLSSDNLALQAHWARYLCIMVSGFLENSIRTIYSEYAKQKASPQIVNFVAHKLKGFQNPRMEKVFQLMASFDEEWGEELKIKTEGEIKYAVNSIINLRNDIAHGKSVGTTYITIRNYYKTSKKLLDIIEEILDPDK